MAKKFVWNETFDGDAGDLITQKQRDRLTKPRYSEIDLIYFAGLMLEGAGVKVEDLDMEATIEIAKDSYKVLANIIANGEYDQAINEDFPVLNG